MGIIYKNCQTLNAVQGKTGGYNNLIDRLTNSKHLPQIIDQRSPAVGMLLFDVVHDTAMGCRRGMSRFHFVRQLAVNVCSTVAELHYRVAKSWGNGGSSDWTVSQAREHRCNSLSTMTTTERTSRRR